MPLVTAQQAHEWQLFVIRTADRTQLLDYPAKNEIEKLIHYPFPLHQQSAYKEWSHLSYSISEKIHREILSIPLSPVMHATQNYRVIEVLNVY